MSSAHSRRAADPEVECGAAGCGAVSDAIYRRRLCPVAWSKSATFEVS